MDPMSIPGAFANPSGGGQQGVFGFDAPPADPAARPTRPALAPAAPAVLDRIKAWARAALPEALVLSEGGPKLELYVRQMVRRRCLHASAAAAAAMLLRTPLRGRELLRACLLRPPPTTAAATSSPTTRRHG